MPKMKSHSGAKKRIRRTGKGALMLKRNSRNHLLQQKSKRQKRLPRAQRVLGTDKKAMQALVPYL
ncbi:50S ribosomal protein L35 [Candidatus Peregrinibacteria bacterium CG10_big_fil_rev_8_21_14_0_10_49_16]|nr:MAG: 50S ribosomal protein L35 [Candidatus Peregrinibacteria bacterium CG22_combo_CG10-13_8_21_14_all_49_11]PIR51748.1 MAG: 50S ribosomal protein L35 [Candidatus Peregrinibacteria bacterium CG10_big_fil_rev_8_21_14_0_10_49_16]